MKVICSLGKLVYIHTSVWFGWLGNWQGYLAICERWLVGGRRVMFLSNANKSQQICSAM